jgi:nitrogen fixation/metabolism regulation signal transduction histidine kinase
MINVIKLNENNISQNQRRIRLQELSGIQISNRDKERLQPRKCNCINEVVSMKQIPMNRKQNVPQKPQPEPEDLIDLEEVLREMGYGEDDDLRDEVEDDEGYNDFIGMMSKTELKQLIQNIVLDTMEETDDLNEIIENLTKE